MRGTFLLTPFVFTMTIAQFNCPDMLNILSIKEKREWLSENKFRKDERYDNV